MTPSSHQLAFRRIAILGVGLIGGSLALALRRAGFSGEIAGYNRQAAERDKALRLGVVDIACEHPQQACADADLVVLAVPPGVMAGLMREIRPACREDALISDVGSSKAGIVAAGEELFEHRFVGAHPIAGKELRGLDAAAADLFENARCVLTPTARTDAVALHRLRSLWEAVGSQVLEMSPLAHDQALALTSHLPHVLAFLLLDQLRVQSQQVDLSRLAGSGLRDFSRIAGSDGMLWADICLENKSALRAALEGFEHRLLHFRKSLDAEDFDGIRECFTQAGAARNAIFKL